ncbi:hypothetical protein JCM9140_192 [Halalkalibacter wakoensis JCM 9140]|uniref:RNA polymerase subunit sigma n=1 Tax=Halalkalibacter wakoensis JCM 9140 TaxID=1236970 RepID=W4PYS8_9BACI|nr:hypothetical protein [Halalkalibacter wakoensis]GAE24279.1 hypothetical protein JCM9140_192 [Halalkalibacter wakoensis JCM 9140]
MSLRPIEVQGSVPISQKTGKIQEQLQQRGQISHDLLTEQQKQQEQKRRKKVNESEGKERVRLNQEDKKQNHPKKKNKKRKQEIEEQEKIDHPYKGKFIDFSG